MATSQENNEGITEDGIEDAFEVSIWVKSVINCLNRCSFGAVATRHTMSGVFM